MKNVSCSLTDFGTQIITDLERFFYLLNLRETHAGGAYCPSGQEMTRKLF